MYIKLYQAIYSNSLTSDNDKCIFEMTSYPLKQANVTAQPLLLKTAEGCMLVLIVQWWAGGQKCVCVWEVGVRGVGEWGCERGEGGARDRKERG